jgi:putative tricarboxylic transport membrane protein
MMFFGTVFGMFCGALPGLTATMACALLVPFTFTMPPTTGLITLGAIYGGAIYGGSFSAILVNAPGTPSSIGTTFDGYPMAKKGEGYRAITIATISSVFGGIFGTLVLIFLAPPLATWSLNFGPTEFFWVAMFGMTIIASVEEKAILKSVIGGFLGMLISTIGIAPIGGEVRFTFGFPLLMGGLQLVVALIGFFCIPEMMNLVGGGMDKPDQIAVKKQKGIVWATIKDFFQNRMVNVFRSSIIGTVTGILPGAGGSIANLIAYNEAKRASKHPEEFGTGCVDGIIATETSNNAVVGSSMIPLFTLGIPGAPPDAIILAALLMMGLKPGAELFTGGYAEITYTFMYSMIAANIMMMFVGLMGGMSLYKGTNRLPIRYLATAVLFLTIIGSYAIRNSMFDVFAMVVCGIVGYLLIQLKFHPAPIVLGLILGPIIEEGFCQTILMSTGRAKPWMAFFDRPLSQFLIVLCVISAFWPLFKKIFELIKKGGPINERA